MKKTINVGNKIIGEGNPCFVIAEAGANWKISPDNEINYKHALKLIDIAAESGADIVKFQIFSADKIYVKDAGCANYLGDEKSIYEIIKDIELPYEWIPNLKKYCDQKEIMFFASPFDIEAVDILEKVGVESYKIASYSITDFPLLKHVANKNKPIFMSTGASTLEEVERAFNYIKKCGNDQLILLQCTAKYPAPMTSINLRTIDTLKSKFGCLIGLSDHSRDPIIAPVGAVALGAKVIEKHYTTDNNHAGPDHKFAVLPLELKKMVDSIRKMEDALGSNHKIVIEEEEELRNFARHFIYSIKSIKKGELFTSENIDTLRCGKKEKGLDPIFYDNIVGKRASCDILPQTPINETVVEN
ncbi:hypothetical protein HN385_01320 [archaeon]|jgi:N,N'-diacetyllegionaminate synthase|nr:hypothetical protein [archaeon]MBT3451349.1 hypothetical protein [archaeon]MBT6869335.1 hypothetical protein [archaeon]MBT7192498.1 hypothetical protein [archaeon]MBT7380574.1 hypothetical protein [archaeon]